MSEPVITPEEAAIHDMVSALKEAGVDDNRVFAKILALFTEIRKLEGLVNTTHDERDYWEHRAARAEGQLKRLTSRGRNAKIGANE